MAMQDILWIVGLVFVVVGVAALGAAAFVFFARDVRGVKADLSGKKRSQAVEEASKNARRSRRKSFTGSLNTGSFSGSLSGSLEGEVPAYAQGPDAAATEPELYTSVISAVEASGDLEKKAAAAFAPQEEDEQTVIFDQLPEVAPAAEAAPEPEFVPVAEPVFAPAPEPAAAAPQHAAAFVGDDEATSVLTGVAPVVAAAAAAIEESADEETTILQSEAAAEAKHVKTPAAAPAEFTIVSKIVLRDSTGIIEG